MKENSATMSVDILVSKHMHSFESSQLLSLQKRIFSSWFFVFVLLFSVISSVLWYSHSVDTATPPTIITYQGKLLEDGASVTTTKSFAFTVYDASTLGTALYTAVGTLPTISTLSITPTQGIFAVDLGGDDTNPIDPALFSDNSELYLEVVVDGTTLTPRKRLTASPYSINSTYLNGAQAASTPQSTTYIPMSAVDGSFSFNTTTFNNAITVSSTVTSTFLGSIDLALGNCFAVDGACITGGSSQWSDAGSDIYFDSGFVGIGTTTPEYELDVDGDVSISGVIRIGGMQMMYRPSAFVDTLYVGNGGASLTYGAGEDGYYNAFVGINSGLSNTTGQYNTAVGASSLSDNSIGSYNSAVGAFALTDNTTGDMNSAFGNLSLRFNTEGDYNSAFGSHSLYQNVTGTANSAFGSTALYSNMGGSYNSAFGREALYLNTTGGRNSAFGTASLYGNTAGESNSAFGMATLVSNISGSFNSAIGDSALNANTTGSYNNALGVYALYQNTTGTNNNAFGQAALYSNVGGDANNAFGNGALNSNTGDYNSAFGHQALLYNTIGTANNAFGYNALLNNTTGVSNNAFGYNALRNNTIGEANVAVGSSALYSNTSSSDNTAIGGQSLYSNSIGGSNTGLGSRSLRSNTEGSNNVGIGVGTLYNSTLGSNNTALGMNSLYTNTEGGYNIGIGVNALSSNTEGNFNTVIGNDALFNNTTGDFNTAIGRGTGSGITTGNYNTILGAQVSGLDAALSNNIIIADGAGNQRIRVLGTGYVGINTTTPAYPLTVEGNSYINGALYVAGTGTSTFAGPVTVGDDMYVNGITVGLGGGSDGISVAVGLNALLSNTTGYSNSAVGADALSSNTTGASNNAFGNSALYANINGAYNNAFGVGALSTNVSGFYNSAFGDAALSANTASNNSAFGAFALINNDTGGNNSAVGSRALHVNTQGVSNVAVGSSALYNNTTGTYNNGVGSTVLYNNTNGIGNNAFGYQALYDMTNGDANVVIGHNTGRGIVTGSYNTIIGSNVTGLGSTLSSNVIIADGQGNQRIRILDTGFVGIGTTTPSYLLHTVRATDGIVAAFTDSDATCTVDPSDGDFSCTSDRNLKTNIIPIESVLEQVMALSPVVYNWNRDPDGEVNYGFIAQDVEAVFPQLVGQGANGYKTLSQLGLIPYLTKAIQEQQEQINALSVSQGQNGTLDWSGGDVNLDGFSLLNTLSISGAAGKWSIDEFGRLVSNVETANGETKSLYGIQSEDGDYVLSGSGQLQGGQVTIVFEEGDKSLIDPNSEMRVSITLTGEANGIFVTDKSTNGFIVHELQNGTSNATFDWMVMTKRVTGGVVSPTEPVTSPEPTPVPQEGQVDEPAGDVPAIVPVEEPVVDPVTEPVVESTTEPTQTPVVEEISIAEPPSLPVDPIVE